MNTILLSEEKFSHKVIEVVTTEIDDTTIRPVHTPRSRKEEVVPHPDVSSGRHTSLSSSTTVRTAHEDVCLSHSFADKASNSANRANTQISTVQKSQKLSELQIGESEILCKEVCMIHFIIEEAHVISP